MKPDFEPLTKELNDASAELTDILAAALGCDANVIVRCIDRYIDANVALTLARNFGND